MKKSNATMEWYFILLVSLISVVPVVLYVIFMTWFIKFIVSCVKGCCCCLDEEVAQYTEMEETNDEVTEIHIRLDSNLIEVSAVVKDDIPSSLDRDIFKFGGECFKTWVYKYVIDIEAGDEQIRRKILKELTRRGLSLDDLSPAQRKLYDVGWPHHMSYVVSKSKYDAVTSVPREMSFILAPFAKNLYGRHFRVQHSSSEEELNENEGLYYEESES